jgi:electron transfer flavoprotein alpha subunit
MNILVFLEQRDAVIKKASLESMSAAADIAMQTGGQAAGLVVGPLPANIDMAGMHGAAKVLHVSDDRLNQYSTTAYTKVAAEAVAVAGVDVVFMAATSMGRDLAPRLAVRMDGAAASDVIAIGVADGMLTATRPVFAGKALEQVRIMTAKQVYTLRPNVFPAKAAGQACPVEPFTCTLEEADFSVKATGTSIASGKLDVAEADMIVSGGRGMQGPEHWGLIEDLAGSIGAATGASRAVVDAGWRPQAEQVGQTGKTVAPSLYIACGISGAIQHLAGMSSSKTIVAINKDKDAPIFQIADYGIVGDVFEVLPVLTGELKKRTGR